jgi:hypothetical protein
VVVNPAIVASSLGIQGELLEGKTTNVDVNQSRITGHLGREPAHMRSSFGVADSLPTGRHGNLRVLQIKAPIRDYLCGVRELNPAKAFITSRSSSFIVSNWIDDFESSA